MNPDQTSPMMASPNLDFGMLAGSSTQFHLTSMLEEFGIASAVKTEQDSQYFLQDDSPNSSGSSTPYECASPAPHQLPLYQACATFQQVPIQMQTTPTKRWGYSINKASLTPEERQRLAKERKYDLSRFCFEEYVF